LIRAFDFLATVAEKSSVRFTLLLRALRLLVRRNLERQSLPENQLFQEISKFEFVTGVWLKELAALLVTFFSPAIHLLLFLETTLDSNLISENQKFVFEGIKQILADRHWPPQRQRCDFIPAPAIN
jgi:hypothetical protein